MNILYKNNIYFFKTDDIEKNMLFLKLKENYNLDDKKINAYIDLYLSKKRYSCSYNKETDELLKKYF